MSRGGQVSFQATHNYFGLPYFSFGSMYGPLMGVDHTKLGFSFSLIALIAIIIICWSVPTSLDVLVIMIAVREMHPGSIKYVVACFLGNTCSEMRNIGVHNLF